MRRLKRWIKKIVYSVVPPPVKQLYNSYSQAGEDAIITFLFNDYKQGRITYLDLGTNIPDYGNNTYLFYTRGYRGVCVEADPTLIKAIQNTRPGDKIINAGVSPSNASEANFYIFNEPSINTFDKKEAEYRESLGNYKIEQIIKVPIITINELIKKNFDTYPDFISLDIEGLDLQVLKTINFIEYPIPILCVETCTYSENHIRPKDDSIKSYLETKGYEVYADTYINTIFVNKKWFYKK